MVVMGGVLFLMSEVPLYSLLLAIFEAWRTLRRVRLGLLVSKHITGVPRL